MSLELIASGRPEPVGPSGDVPGLTTVSLGPERIQLIGVRIAAVQKRPLARHLELLGYVAMDESRVRRVQARVSGWAQEVFVGGTGESVRLGQEMLSISSPEVQQTEQNYVNELAGRGTALAGAHGAEGPHAARGRLALFGVPDDEIGRVEREGTPLPLFTLRAPVQGMVVSRDISTGERIEPGATLFTIADLGTVRVQADLYEMDFERVRTGDPATFEADALPGRTFGAHIDLVSPSVSSETRTLKVRMAVDNQRGLLKPGMYGRVRVRGRGGPALTVPSEAVVNTGEHQYVFLARGEGRFEPRMVWTGQTDGDQVEIVAGVAEDDTVVASASFLIDSESRLQAAIRGMGPGSGR